MIRSLNQLLNYQLKGLDRYYGQVDDFLIDQFAWKVRYFVSDAQEILDNRRIILAFRALHGLDDVQKAFFIQMDEQKLFSSPSFENALLSHSQEMTLARYYDWPFYWQPGETLGLGPGVASMPMADLVEQMRESNDQIPGLDESHLQRFTVLKGINLKARDGELGNVEDVLVEDESWNVLYLVVSTGGWLSGRKVLLSPNWVQEVRGNLTDLIVDLNQETVRNSPVFEDIESLDDDYHQRLKTHYGR